MHGIPLFPILIASTLVAAAASFFASRAGKKSQRTQTKPTHTSAQPDPPSTLSSAFSSASASASNARVDKPQVLEGGIYGHQIRAQQYARAHAQSKAQAQAHAQALVSAHTQEHASALLSRSAFPVERRAVDAREHGVCVWLDEDHVHHAGDPAHYESPARVLAIHAACKAAGMSIRYPASRVLPGRTSASKSWELTKDPDTYRTPMTSQIVERAQNMVHEALREVLSRHIRAGFVALRPPGHHASATSGPRGFCHSNNAWTAVLAAKAAGIQRISILDWDAHHGDGSEEHVRDYNSELKKGGRRGDVPVRFVSMHCAGEGVYPGTGSDSGQSAAVPVSQTRRGSASPSRPSTLARHDRPCTMNIAFRKGTGSREWMKAFESRALPFLLFSKTLSEDLSPPDLLIVSAGYDAHAEDPLKLLKLTAATYGQMAQRLADLGCPVLFLLEGGYNPAALADSVIASLRPFQSLSKSTLKSKSTLQLGAASVFASKLVLAPAPDSASATVPRTQPPLRARAQAQA